MKKRLLIALAAVCCAVSSLFGENPVKDAGFDTDRFEDSFYVQSGSGTVAVSRIVEDLTWNKCLKLEITGFSESQDRKMLEGGIVFGRTGDGFGFAAEPDTVYHFSFDVKGSPQLSISVGLDPAGVTPGENPRTVIRPNPPVVKPSPEQWCTVKGSFKTNSDTGFMRLRLLFWADSRKQRVFPLNAGDFVLLDNVRIEKRRSLDDAASSAGQTARETSPVRAYETGRPVQANLKVMPLPWLDGVPDVPARLSWEESDGKLRCRIEYDEPDNGGHSHSAKPQSAPENGTKIWKDDVAELFFSSDPANRDYVQFACSRSGGRCRLVGKKEDGAYDQWSASVESREGRTACTFDIPYPLIGFEGAPPPGTLLKFNAGIKHNGISYSFAPIKTDLRDVANFVLLGFGSVRDHQLRAASELKKEAPDSMAAEIDAFAREEFADLAGSVRAAAELKSRIVSARLGKAPFVLARLPLNADFSAPLEVGVENVVKEPVRLRVAGREIAMVPLAIVNRTGKTASYRVVVHDDPKNFKLFENPTLAGGFPAGNITLREGIRIKDSDGADPGALFDSLPRVNEAQVVTAAAGEAALVWLELDATGVKPGTYEGSVRVIPLEEPAVHKASEYKGEIRDFPVSLEVLPFELPDPRPGWLCSGSPSADYLRYMMQLGLGRVHISPFAFRHKFDLQGNLIDDNGSTERGIAEIRSVLEQYRALDALHVKRKFLYGYSAYRTFLSTSMPKGMKELTPEWENCWRNHLKAVRETILQSGISMDDVVFEILDEPQGKDHPVLLRATQIMREALPDAILSMTWPPQNFGFTADMMKSYDELLDEQVFHCLLRENPAYLPQIRRITARENTLTGLYECNTGIREDLHTYFRLHPWRTFHTGCGLMGFYQFSASPWGRIGATDWKRIPGGAIVCRSGDRCIPSIRFMLLRRGVDDIRYLDALKDFADKPEVAEFLKKAPDRVLNAVHDFAVPDRIRDEAVELLKKYHR